VSGLEAGKGLGLGIRFCSGVYCCTSIRMMLKTHMHILEAGLSIVRRAQEIAFHLYIVIK
jgi:hypothetical protein